MVERSSKLLDAARSKELFRTEVHSCMLTWVKKFFLAHGSIFNKVKRSIKERTNEREGQ